MDVLLEGRWLVTRRLGWWVVDDIRTHETVSGGWPRKRDALDEARRLAGELS
jgi:hypothetical protein